MQRKYLILVVLATLSIVLDQVTKFWIRDNLPEGAYPITVIPDFFRIIHAENPGAAWGIFRDAHWRIPFFVVTTVLAFGIIGSYFRRLAHNDYLQAVALSLILGGAVGNFIDRIMFKSVTDFLEFYVGWEPTATWFIQNLRSNRWPAFNVADISIVVGIGLALYHIFFIEPRLEKEAAAAAAASAEGASGGNT